MSNSPEVTSRTVFFERAGRANTERTLALAHARAKELGLPAVLVATTGGETGIHVAQLFQEFDVIVITHSTGFKEPDVQELAPEARQAIQAAGARVLTCQHAFGGVGRAVRKKLGTYELDEIVAHTLRLFGEGTKVVVEMALMAADAGLVRTDIPVMAIAGTGRGADTAAVLLPTNAQAFFDLKILEFVCRPSPKHPALTSSCPHTAPIMSAGR